MLEKLPEVIVQTVFAFFAILILTRFLGKQQIAQLTFYDYVNGITIGSIAGIIATETDGHTIDSAIALFLFVALTLGASVVSLKSRAARKILEGEPVIVIQNGQVLEKNMAVMQYNMDDLLTQLRQKDVFRVSDVEFAILEPNGTLSVLKKSQQRPLTPKDVQIPTSYEGLSSEFIVDGQIIHSNLYRMGLNGRWLMEQLARQGISSVNEVNYAELQDDGALYVDRKKDSLTHPLDITDQ